MNNQYIFYPKIDLDLRTIKKIVYKHLNKPIPGTATHHRLVKDEPYLMELQQKYPFFSDIYNIYPSHPNAVIPLHICPDRSCALNIPIQYTEDSHTIFYELDKEDFTYNEERIYKVFASKANEVFRYTLTDPVIMNTLLPHSVTGGPKRMRIIMSWSIKFNVTYEDLRKQYG